MQYALKSCLYLSVEATFASNPNQIQGNVYMWFKFYNTGCYVLYIYMNIHIYLYFFFQIDIFSLFNVITVFAAFHSLQVRFYQVIIKALKKLKNKIIFIFKPGVRFEPQMTCDTDDTGLCVIDGFCRLCLVYVCLWVSRVLRWFLFPIKLVIIFNIIQKCLAHWSARLTNQSNLQN